MTNRSSRFDHNVLVTHKNVELITFERDCAHKDRLVKVVTKFSRPSQHMNLVLLNCILIIYIISPVIVIILFGILIYYGGRIAEAIGVMVFIIMIFGHIRALVITSKNRKHLECKYLCADVILFIAQLMFAVSGILIGISNVLNEHFSCFATHKHADYHDTLPKITTTPTYKDDYSIEVSDVCGLSIGFFISSLVVLIIRCWVYPIVEKYGKNRRKQR